MKEWEESYVTKKNKEIKIKMIKKRHGLSKITNEKVRETRKTTKNKNYLKTKRKTALYYDK